MVDFCTSTVWPLRFCRSSTCWVAAKPPLPSGLKIVVLLSCESGLVFFVFSTTFCTTCNPPFRSGLDVVRTNLPSPLPSVCFSSSVTCISVFSPLGPRANDLSIVRTVVAFTWTVSFSTSR